MSKKILSAVNRFIDSVCVVLTDVNTMVMPWLVAAGWLAGLYLLAHEGWWIAFAGLFMVPVCLYGGYRGAKAEREDTPLEEEKRSNA